MSGNDQPSTVTQTTTNKLPSYLSGPIDKALRYSVAAAGKPAFPGSRVAPLPDDAQTAMGMIRTRATQGSPAVNAAGGLLTSTLEGDYLDPSSNPWLKATYDKAAGDVMDTYNTTVKPNLDAQMARAGAFGIGNSAWEQLYGQSQENLGETLNNLATDIYGGNYQQERARQMQAAGLAPGLAEADYRDAQTLLGIGDIQRNYAQQLLDQQYSKYYHPQEQAQMIADIAARIMGGQGTQTTTGPNPNQQSTMANALGFGLGGAGIGSAFGPLGAGIGGVLGLLGGLFV